MSVTSWTVLAASLALAAPVPGHASPVRAGATLGGASMGDSGTPDDAATPDGTPTPTRITARADTVVVRVAPDAPPGRPLPSGSTGRGLQRALSRIREPSAGTAAAEEPAVLQLAPGHYYLTPSDYRDPACGNCEEPRPDSGVAATVGLRVSGRALEIRGAGVDRTVIHTNAGYGILFDGCRDCTLRNVAVTGGRRDPDGRATDAGVVVRESRVRLEECAIRDNVGDSAAVHSVVVGIAGVAVREGGEATVRGCRIVRNSWDGIALYRGARADVRGTLVDGIDRASGAEIGGGRGVGIGLTWDARATVVGNLVRNYWKGIGAFVDAEAEVRENVVEDVLTWGIALWDAGRGSPEAIISRNAVYRTGACGAMISLAGASSPSGSDPVAGSDSAAGSDSTPEARMGAGRFTENLLVATASDERYDSGDPYCTQRPIAREAVPPGFPVRDNLLHRNRQPGAAPKDPQLSRAEFLRRAAPVLRELRSRPVLGGSRFLSEFVGWEEASGGAGALAAQEPADVPGSEPTDLAVPRFRIEPSAIQLSGEARPRAYLGAVGRRAAWLGFESGEAEVWLHPLKAVRDLSLAFRIPEYAEPVEGADVARTVTVRPAVTTITYTHATFTVKEHVLPALDRPGVLVLLEAETVRPLEILVRFRPVLQYQWPAGLGGQYVRWDAAGNAFVLSESLQERNVILGSPRATEASAHPAHRLSEAPSVFTIPVDATRAGREYIPVAVAGGEMGREEAWAAYRELIAEAEAVYRERREHVRRVLEQTVRIESPDPELDRALRWAEWNLAEQRACSPGLGCGLVAGWGPSGTSLRPGFGWFFGGDAAINTLAMDVTGQWEDVADGLAFLARHQREDGKIPHEISLAALHVPWFEEYPYPYYHADTTPYWILATLRYWRASGDEETLEELWPAVRRAYGWCLSAETDGDGIIENTAGGFGAVEVGDLGAELHQDIYLAAVWIEALEAVSELARRFGEEGMAAEADSIRRLARETLNERYWREGEGHHAFGILADGSTNDNLTAWPATAAAFGLLDAERADRTLAKLTTDSISAEWGARMLSAGSDLYDPLHYNNGTVWPFVTGWVARAQYAYRRPWAGWPLVDAVKQVTFDWALGRHPELFSGAFYQPLDAAVPHQFFATSMLVTPLLRGTLGWRPDAPRRRAELAPQLPPAWRETRVENLPVGASRLDVSFSREPARGSAGRGRLAARIVRRGPPVTLSYRPSLPAGARDVRAEVDGEAVDPRAEPRAHDVAVELELQPGAEAVEVVLTWSGGLVPSAPTRELVPGQRSGGLRVVDWRADGGAGGWVLVAEGEAGGTYALPVHGVDVTVASAEPADGRGGAAGARLEAREAGEIGKVREAGNAGDGAQHPGAGGHPAGAGEEPGSRAAVNAPTAILHVSFPEGEGRRLVRVRLTAPGS